MNTIGVFVLGFATCAAVYELARSLAEARVSRLPQRERPSALPPIRLHEPTRVEAMRALLHSETKYDRH